MNLPNKLTIFRIFLVPIMVLIPYLGFNEEVFGIPMYLILVDIIFIIASITDKLDGTIARKKNLVTDFGKFLDPIADKILVIAALIILVDLNKIPSWIPIIVIFREFLVSGFRLVAASKGGKVIAASIWGKIKTVTQMIAIILAFIDKFNFADFIWRVASKEEAMISTVSIYMTFPEYLLNILVSMLMIVSVLATIISGIDYLKGGKEYLKDK